MEFLNRCLPLTCLTVFRSVGWLSSVGSLAHVSIASGPLSTPYPQISALLASLGSAGSVVSATTSAPKGSVCDTGEPLSPRVLQLLKSLEFIELHEFLPAPLLRELRATDTKTPCGCCHSHHVLGKRPTKTVGDVFTWMLCFHRFVAAASTFHPGKVSQFLAYSNTILRAYLEFEGDGWRAYNRAFRLQVSGRPSEDWSVLNLPLYARLFTAQSRRRNSCRYCSGQDHTSDQCPWGVDVVQPTARSFNPHSGPGEPPICLSWNSGACRFPTACHFRHVCSHCLAPHQAKECPLSPFRRRTAGPPLGGPPRRFRPMGPTPPR